MRRRRGQHSLVALIVTLTLATASDPAQASGPLLPKRGLFVLPGLTLGGTSSFDVGTGFTLGGEVSIAYWYRGLWAGLVSDGLYDWKRERGRLMFGAEAGWGPFGVDGGYLLEVGEDGPAGSGKTGALHGLGVRFVVSLGLVQFYSRYGGMFDAPDFMEWGLLIKIPLTIFAERYPHQRGRYGRDRLPPPPPKTKPPRPGPNAGPSADPSTGAKGPPNSGPDAGPSVAPTTPVSPPKGSPRRAPRASPRSPAA
jgi:hypothetical protein